MTQIRELLVLIKIDFLCDSNAKIKVFHFRPEIIQLLNEQNIETELSFKLPMNGSCYAQVFLQIDIIFIVLLPGGKQGKKKHKQKNKNSSKKILRKVYLLPVNVISFTFLSSFHVLTILSSSVVGNKYKKRKIKHNFLFSLDLKTFYWFCLGRLTNEDSVLSGLILLIELLSLLKSILIAESYQLFIFL